MTAEHNTPASGDIAREAAILMHENSYFRNGLLTPNSFIDAAKRSIQSAIDKAIARDRAEREAELAKLVHSNQCLSSEVAALSLECGELVDAKRSTEAKLAEQSAALDAAKDALLAAGSYYDWDGAGENEPCVFKQRAALAKIEALAGKGGK